MKKSFTLVETLITLAIIGIIAALTIPTLIREYKRSEYKNAFHVAHKRLSSAIEQMVSENVNNVVSFNWDRSEKTELFFKDIAKHMGGAKNIYIYSWNSAQSGIKGKTYYNDKEKSIGSTGCGNTPTVELNIGIDIIKIDSCYLTTAAGLDRILNVMIVDTNSAKRGPNRFGYDVFAFEVDTETLKVIPMGKTRYGHDRPYKCGTQGKSKFDIDYGCSYYAIIDKCPEDPTKGYWECLKI